MNALKLNSIPNSVFEVKGANDITVKTCSGKTISRNDIIATGRLVACEYIGSRINEDKNTIVRYASRLAGSKFDYATAMKRHADNKFLFCANNARKVAGAEPYADLATAKNDVQLAKDETFLKTMAAIDREVITPLFFRVIDDVSFGSFMHWEPVALGTTKEITVRSNDAFVFEDSSWGSYNNGTRNYLYNDTITLSPKMKSCSASIKWFQDVVNGDSGQYYAAIIRGMWSKIYATFYHALKAATKNADYMPRGLVAETYTPQNWLKITSNLAAACGVKRSDLLGFGSAEALNEVLPMDKNGALLGMQSILAKDWFENGYLQRAGQVDLCELQPVIVPGTQNSSLTRLDDDDSLYIAVKAGGAAAMEGVYVEGQPVTIEIKPANNTSDLTIDLTAGAMFDIAPILANKIGKIGNV